MIISVQSSILISGQSSIPISGQSQSDYYKALGYLMDGEKAENQDDFLTRMSGIVRLFATICLTQPPPKGLFGSDDAGDGENAV